MFIQVIKMFITYKNKTDAVAETFKMVIDRFECAVSTVITCFSHHCVNGWHGGLVVGRRTCDLRVAGSRPGRDAAAQQP